MELSKIEDLPVPNKVVRRGATAVRKYCMTKYDVKGTLGKGSYGTISAVCDRDTKECNSWVLKRIRVGKRDVDEVRDEVRQEVFILRKLHGSGLAPELLSAWVCKNTYNLVLERFDVDMKKLGLEQYAKSGLPSLITRVYGVHEQDYTVLLYTWSQWRQMLQLAIALGQTHGIVHGDSKPDNLLYRRKDDKVVYTDFGFSGDHKHYRPRYGWSGPGLGCPTLKDVPNEPVYTSWFNVWELLQYFKRWTITIVRLGERDYRVFNGHEDVVPKAAEDRFLRDCHNPTKSRTELTGRYASKQFEMVGSGSEHFDPLYPLPQSLMHR